jgi:hypothetical protein
VQIDTALAVNQAQDAVLIERVLHSRVFQRASSLKRLLHYLWGHHSQDISEYAIATEALGRPPDFDSKVDATVRVQVGRLRRTLEKFYAEEGAAETRRLEIPVGSHQLVFVDRQEIVIENSSNDPEKTDSESRTFNGADTTRLDVPDSRVQTRPIFPGRIGYVVAACVIACTVLLPVIWLRGRVNSEKREVPQFWKSFLDNGKSMRIVLPAPVFFSLEQPNQATLMLRDISVNDPSRWADSPMLNRLIGSETPHFRVWQGYTVASDTFASLRFARFMDQYGIQTNFSSSADLPKAIVDHENIVAFGTKNSLAGYQDYLDKLTFRMAPHETKVVDLLSPPGQTGEFKVQDEAGSRQIIPGIIAVVPIGNNGSRLFLLQGAQTTALISYLTSEDGMKEMMEQTRRLKTPYFEAVVLSEVNRGTPLQSRLGAIRSYKDRGAGEMAKLMQIADNTK